MYGIESQGQVLLKKTQVGKTTQFVLTDTYLFWSNNIYFVDRLLSDDSNVWNTSQDHMIMVMNRIILAVSQTYTV